MKLDPVFTVKENKLFMISDNSEVNPDTLKQVQIPWSTVEMEEESYNEEYLAKLRDDLKALETSHTYAILVPVLDKPLDTPEQLELFTNAYNHTARRVKDAESVAGFLLPVELLRKGMDIVQSEFIDVIAKKHAQYVYFAEKENSEFAKKSPEIVAIL